MAEVLPLAVVRGTVKEKPLYPQNGGETRCVFEMDLLLKEECKSFSLLRSVRVRVVTQPSMAEACRKFVEKGVRVSVAGTLTLSHDIPKLAANLVATNSLALTA